MRNKKPKLSNVREGGVLNLENNESRASNLKPLNIEHLIVLLVNSNDNQMIQTDDHKLFRFSFFCKCFSGTLVSLQYITSI